MSNASWVKGCELQWLWGQVEPCILFGVRVSVSISLGGEMVKSKKAFIGYRERAKYTRSARLGGYATRGERRCEIKISALASPRVFTKSWATRVFRPLSYPWSILETTWSRPLSGLPGKIWSVYWKGWNVANEKKKEITKPACWLTKLAFRELVPLTKGNHLG